MRSPTRCLSLFFVLPALYYSLLSPPQLKMISSAPPAIELVRLDDNTPTSFEKLRNGKVLVAGESPQQILPCSLSSPGPLRRLPSLDPAWWPLWIHSHRLLEKDRASVVHRFAVKEGPHDHDDGLNATPVYLPPPRCLWDANGMVVMPPQTSGRRDVSAARRRWTS